MRPNAPVEQPTSQSSHMGVLKFSDWLSGGNEDLLRVNPKALLLDRRRTRTNVR